MKYTLTTKWEIWRMTNIFCPIPNIYVSWFPSTHALDINVFFEFLIFKAWISFYFEHKGITDSENDLPF